MQIYTNCEKIIKEFATNNNLTIFAAGKSYTTSSCRTPPGPEGSKGMWL